MSVTWNANVPFLNSVGANPSSVYRASIATPAALVSALQSAGATSLEGHALTDVVVTGVAIGPQTVDVTLPRTSLSASVLA
ncbi:MAG: hypothetical protein AAGC46_15880, partial [Solirubrobacteraceae bacterium]